MKSGIFVKLLSTAVLTALGLMILTAVALSQLKQSMLDDRQAKVKSLSEVARDVVKGFHARAQAGEFDEATAKAQAMETLRRVRYQGEEYYFIYDFDGVNVMHSVRPEREGKNFIDSKDADGHTYIRTMLDGIKATGMGLAFYKFPRAGSDVPSPKVSVMVAHAPWKWAVGTGVYIDDMDAEFRAAATKVALVAILVVLLSVGLVAYLARGISQPLTKMAGAAERLAGHDFSVEVGETGRADEIGALARSLSSLRNEAAERARNLGEQQEAERRAGQERHQSRMRMADDVENSIKRAADVITGAASQMEAAARAVTGAVDDAGGQASAVASAAEHAAANVATVATAAEELSASIREISSQVQQSSTISGEAVAEAERTNDLVRSLAEAAGRIGYVVNLINDIAGQTNLLALNATIEAARAGDAGKGFAVVASEVKNLANQTSRATEEISAQIGAVQSRTREAVDAIRNIGGTITRINEIAAAIAAAVEQQGAATAEIARNVQEASAGTSEVTDSLGRLNAATAEAGGSAAMVLASAQGLTGEAGLLQDEVGKFLSTIRG